MAALTAVQIIAVKEIAQPEKVTVKAGVRGQGDS